MAGPEAGNASRSGHTALLISAQCGLQITMSLEFIYRLDRLDIMSLLVQGG